jgi:NAD(P)-dependent dehydrogenase (short-subunit alcohol dehydrogenase family)
VRPRLPARTALVTGATGGLGQEISIQLAREGLQLFLHGRDRSRLTELALKIERTHAPPPEILTADFADLGSVATLCAELESRTEGLDLLINNAGTGFQANPVTADGYRRTFQVNYLAPYLLTRRLLPLMRGRRGATVVNVASTGQADLPATLARSGEAPSAVAYGQSKLALIMATRTLAEELGGCPPRVLAVHPGSMLDTQLTHILLARMPRWVTLAWRLSRQFRPTVAQSARFVADCALNPGDDPPSGTFLTAKGPGRIRRQASDPAARQALETFSMAAINCFPAPEPAVSKPGEYEEIFAELDPL